MPQFEVELTTPEPIAGLYRGRNAEDAVRNALGYSSPIDIGDEEDLLGWRQVDIGGESAGRVRLHQRMRFRRD